MALLSNERILVEAVKKAPKITIVIPGYDGKTGDAMISVQNKKFIHDCAIALQSYFVNAKSI